MTSRSADHKERQLVAYLVDRLMQNSFDERELYSLYILLREYAPNGSPVRELSDFVAHRRRDRGGFLKFLEKHRESMEILPKDSGTGGADLIDQALAEPGVFTAEEVLDSINCTLRTVGISPLPTARANDILLCTMSLLQDVRFLDESKVEVGKLILVISAKYLGLLGTIMLSDGQRAAVAVLSLPNVYHPFTPRSPKEVGMMPNTAVKVVRESGRLVVHSL